MARKKRYQHDADAPEVTELPPSRSQKKRDSTALQRTGEALAKLSPAKLKQLGLPPDLLDALIEHRTLSTHEAKRRQMQYVGRLMREAHEAGTLPDLDL